MAPTGKFGCNLRHRLKFASVLLVLLLVVGLRGVVAEDTAQPITRLPPDAVPISEYFYTGQKVYDGQGTEIGDVNDVLLDTNGKVTAVIIGVGGGILASEKNVAVAFSALEVAEKDFKSYVVLDIPKKKLELAPGFEFDRAKRRWIPAAARLIDGKAEDK